VPELDSKQECVDNHETYRKNNIASAVKKRVKDKQQPGTIGREEVGNRKIKACKQQQSIPHNFSTGQCMIHHTACLRDLTCERGCGINRAFLSCDVEWEVAAAKGLLIPVDVFRNQPRGSGMQLEKVRVSMDALELKELLIATGEVALPHHWNVVFATAQLAHLYNTFEGNMVVYVTDFGALRGIHAQDRLNCAHDLHYIQNMAILSINPRIVIWANNSQKRVSTNICVHTLIEQGHGLKASAFTHHEIQLAVLRIIQHADVPVILQCKETPDTVITPSDGCGPQYKCRDNAAAGGKLLQEIPNYHLHMHAINPAGSFKGNHDGETGNFHRQQEDANRREGVKMSNTWQIFTTMPGIMKQPKPVLDVDKKDAMHVDARIFLYLTSAAHFTAEMAAAITPLDGHANIYRHNNAPFSFVVVVDIARRAFDGRPLITMNDRFQFTAIKTNSVEMGAGESKEEEMAIAQATDVISLFSRSTNFCFCASCLVGDFIMCPFRNELGTARLETFEVLPSAAATQALSTSEKNALYHHFFFGAQVGELSEGANQHVIVSIAVTVSEHTSLEFYLLVSCKQHLRDTNIKRIMEGDQGVVLVGVKAGDYSVKLRKLLRHHDSQHPLSEGWHKLPPGNSKQLEYPLANLILPNTHQELGTTRLNYLGDLQNTSVPARGRGGENFICKISDTSYDMLIASHSGDD
jgi:hypothetical protein